jgi:hypothetical protein
MANGPQLAELQLSQISQLARRLKMPNVADPEIWHFSDLDLFFLFFLVSVNCLFGERKLVT